MVNNDINDNKSCCCDSSADCCNTNTKSIYKYTDVSSFIDKYITTPIGEVAVVKTVLNYKDKLGSFRVRLGIKRDDYRLQPGLYAAGSPNDKSPVLVSANYKLSFDALRCELKDVNAWIVVLDTKGINVWCAAGKGTFGTDEIISKIKTIKLSKIVSHKKIILPQLGAPGVQAHEITKATGFKVIYGPVRAEDIKSFLDNDMIAANEMRKVHFTFKDRLIVTPVEINMLIKYVPIIFIFFLVYNFISSESLYFLDVITKSLLNILPFIGAIVVATFIVPILLPIIPFKAFSLKGFIAGTLWAAIVLFMYNAFSFPVVIMFKVAITLILISITSYLPLYKL